MNDSASDRDRISAGLRRLDHLPAWAGLAIGAVMGGAAGAAVVFDTALLDGGLFLLLLAVGVALVLSGEPVVVLEPEAAGDDASDTVAPRLRPPKGRFVQSKDLVPIPAGSFRMGSPDAEEGRWDDEGPVHEVRVSAFQCLRTPVTRQLYEKVMGEDPGWPEGKADVRPVNKVSWFDAARFCNRLSKEEGLEPCYEIDSRDVRWQLSADGFRLPTEAEWEYACRAGTQGRWSFGENEKDLGDHAWYGGNSGNKPQPVGEKKPNPWGLHDMHGHVREWCWDWFGPYSEEPQVDPTGSVKGRTRVLRGGSFFYEPRGLRSADRNWVRPGNQIRFIGFRCVRAPHRQTWVPGNRFAVSTRE